MTSEIPLDQTKKEHNVRKYGIDLLRILMMFLIVLRHGSYQSGATSVPDIPLFNYLTGVAITGITGIAVNCFVLISGYFLCKQSFRIDRIIKLYVATLFYSICVAFLFSIYYHSFSLKSLIHAIFPLCTGFSWFVSYYIVLSIISPFMNRCLCRLTQKEFLGLLGILLFFFSLIPSFGLSTFSQPGGYTFTWFIVLYCAGAYLSFFGNIGSTKKNVICFLFSISVVFCFLGLRFVLKKKGIILEHPDNYDFLPTFFASFFCFRVFLSIKVPVFLNACILKISPLMLGCYLFHDNSLKHALWKDLMGINKHVNDNWWFVHMIACIFAVFFAGCVFEQIRQVLFRGLSCPINRMGEWFHKRFLLSQEPIRSGLSNCENGEMESKTAK